jgi:hypothetical protein
MKSVYGIPVLDLKMLPEQMVIDAADMYREEDPENSFVRLLRAGEEFKDAGLTPIYLSDKPMKRMMVTTKEKMQKKYH